MRNISGAIILHGAIILVLGLLIGLPFGNAITDGAASDVIRAWRVAHTGVVMGGLMILVLGAVADRLVLSERAASLLYWSLIVGGYGFVIALPVGAAFGVRGLEPTDPFINGIVFVANTAAGIGSLVGAGVVVVGAASAQARWRQRGSGNISV